MRFQHNNNIIVTPISYNYVKEYKKQLIFNITKLLNDLNIKFVIGHGNLLEYERGLPIHHDDDLDIRMDIKDFPKWENFCKKSNKETKYNLLFDSRFKKMKSQKYNGIQCRLIKFNNKKNIKEFKMDIHCDLVASTVGTDFWLDYNINNSDLRKIKYLDVNTYAPNKDDTKRVLTIRKPGGGSGGGYGKNYLKPHKPPAF